MLQGVIAELELSPLLITFQARCGRYWKFSFLQRNGIVMLICKKMCKQHSQSFLKGGKDMWYGGNPCFAKQRGSCSKIDQDKHGGHFQRLQLKETLLTSVFRLQGNRWLLHSWPMSLDLLCWQKWGYCIDILLTIYLQALLPLLGQGAQTRSQVSKVLKSWRKLLRKCQCQDQSNIQ